jgi:hypothetical protein
MLCLSLPLPPVVEDGTGTGAALLVLVLSCASSMSTMCLAVGTNSDRETPVRLSRPARLAVLPPSGLHSSVVTLITGRDDLDLHTPRARCAGPLFLTAVLCRRARAARPPFSLSIRDVLCCSQSVPLLTRPRYTSSARGLIDICLCAPSPSLASFAPASSSSSSTYRRGPSMQLSPSAYYTSTTLEH